jgi:short-subunit dehydrogenase involved in D-alanine esterification of teichoic acids
MGLLLLARMRPAIRFPPIHGWHGLKTRSSSREANINLQYTAGLHFEGQTALVTGASRGIGREIALRLAHMGAYVGVNYVSDAAAAESLVEEIRASGGRALRVQADVGEPSQIQGVIEKVTAELGPVSVPVTVYAKGRTRRRDFFSG